MREHHSWEAMRVATVIFTDGKHESVTMREPGLPVRVIVFEPDAVVIAETSPYDSAFDPPPGAIRINLPVLRALRRFPAVRVAQVVYDY